MPPDPDAIRTAAQDLAARGWPVMPVQADGKEPLTRHGVKDATTDERTILHWLDRWPDANLGVATGAPGPTVLDIDNLDKGRHVLVDLERLGMPQVATTRGRHLYFRGATQGTIKLDYGELRGRGSYVVCPPSIHPSGKQYTWLVEPGGPLHDVPAHIIGDKQTAGAGTFDVPREKISHGGRHDHLKDFAVRLIRAGVLDPPTIARMLEAEYQASCVTTPPAKPDEFEKLAAWAARSAIAGRERQRATQPEPTLTESGIRTPPNRDAPLNEHRDYLAAAGGWAPIGIADVIRDGGRPIDALRIVLTNGQVVEFSHQGDITTRGTWDRTLRLATNGIADPPNLKGWELSKVLSSLCILASAPAAQLEADDLQSFFGDFLELVEPLTGHTLRDSTSRYELIVAVRARPAWNPRDVSAGAAPVLVVDEEDGLEYVRAGDVWRYMSYQNVGIAPTAFPGRMNSIGLTRVAIDGRESPAPGRTGSGRQKARMQLYRIEP
jgi:hypothetical protein